MEIMEFNYSNLRKWIYGRNNFCDFLGRVEGDVTFVVRNPLAILTLSQDEKERAMEIERFMPEVIYWDFSTEWERCRTNVFLNSLNEILWQQDY